MALSAVALEPEARRLSEDIAFHRLNEHYRPALILARLLLDQLSFSGTAGSNPFVAFLVDMDWLFERYLGVVLKRAAGAWGVQVVEQEHCALDHAGRLSVRPDIVLYRRDRPQLVVNAKYKLAEACGDVYQMLAYCHAVGLNKGILVYPAGETMPAGALAIRGPGDALIGYLALDLGGGIERLEAHAKQLWDAVRAWFDASADASSANSSMHKD
jgi:5-methylcytosine-specific restriction enzyme subunit McrC